MGALAWLLIPIAAVAVATAWSSWASRRRTTTPDTVGVAGYERFRVAMERSSAASRPAGDRERAAENEQRDPPDAPSGSSSPEGPARAAD